ncbi:MAG: YfjI family protein [Rhodoferax sp.]
MNARTDFNDQGFSEGLAAVAASVASAEEVNAELATINEQPWPEPSIPGVLRTPEVPCNILPGVWGQMAQAVADCTQTPTAMSVMAVLGVLGAVLHGRYEIDCGSHREILAFWGTTVSASGTRKSAVMGHFQEPLLHWEKLVSDRMRREIIRNEAIRSTTAKRIESLKQQAAKANPEEMKALRDEIEREEIGMPDEMKTPSLFTEDSTPETMQRLLSENSGRMAVLSDEPGLFRILGGLYSKGGASLDVFLKGHVGSALKVARAAHSIYVKRPCVTMSLMIQPDMVSELAGSNQFRSSGLMARFFYAVPVSNVGKRDVRKRHRVPDVLVDAYDAAVQSLMCGYPPEAGESLKPKILVFDELADDLWLDFSQEIENQHGDGGPLEPLRDWTSKLAGAVARIATLIEIATVGLGAEVVGLESMHQAIKLGRLMIPHTQAAFNLLGADSTEGDAIHVLKWIRGQALEEFTQRGAHRALESRFKTTEKLKKAIDKLHAWGCIRQIQRKTLNGRPSVVFSVNPGVLA